MNIAVYCSSRADLPQQCAAAAHELGKWIGENGCTLVYGGVNAGLMHTVAQAAHENNAKIVGVIPQFFQHRADSLNDELIVSQDLNDRKAKMIHLAHTFVVLPGGLGTLDEWFATLSQLIVDGDSRKIVVVNIDHVFDHAVEQLVDTAQSPFARSNAIIDAMCIVTSVPELIQALNNIKNQNNYEK